MPSVYTTTDTLTADQRAALFGQGYYEIRQANGFTFDANGTVLKTNAALSIGPPESPIGGPYGPSNTSNTVAALAVLPNGETAAFWSMAIQNLNASFVLEQRFDPSGTPIGPAEFVVSLPYPETFTISSAAGLSNGNYVVQWSHAVPPLSTSESQLFAVDQPVGTLATTSLTGRVIALADGGYASVWRGASNQYFIAKYDSSGHQIGSTTTLSGTFALPTSLADGGFILTIGKATGAPLAFQRYDSTGTAVGGELTFNGLDAPLTVVLSEMKDGSYLTTWSQVLGSKAEIFQEHFDLAGNRLGSLVQLTHNQSVTHSVAGVAVLNDGSYVVLWNENDGSGALPRNYTQHFTSGGDAIGDPEFIGAGQSAKIISLPNGGYMTDWSNSQTNTAIQSFQTTLSLDYHELTTGSDLIAGGGGDAWIVGAPGDINSGDSLFGGGGYDRLVLSQSGVINLSTLTAFSGFEQISGAGGDDTFIVGPATFAAGMTIDGGGGDDRIQLASSGSLNLSALTLVSIESIVGSSGGDVLTGDGGANVLNGGLGSDVMYGVAGDDILRDGGETANRDFLYGGSGNDTYYVTSAYTAANEDLVYEGGSNPDLMAGVNDIDIIHSGGDFFWDYYSVGEVLYIDATSGSPLLVGGKDVLNKTIYGGAGNDRVVTYGHNSVVDLGAGTDAVDFGPYGLDSSYNGHNTLVMRPGTGIDYIYNFHSGTDKVDLTAFHFGITGAQVLAQAVNVDNPGTANDYSYFYLTNAGGIDNFVVFMGLLGSQLQAGDFLT